MAGVGLDDPGILGFWNSMPWLWQWRTAGNLGNLHDSIRKHSRGWNSWLKRWGMSNWVTTQWNSPHSSSSWFDSQRRSHHQHIPHLPDFFPKSPKAAASSPPPPKKKHLDSGNKWILTAFLGEEVPEPFLEGSQGEILHNLNFSGPFLSFSILPKSSFTSAITQQIHFNPSLKTGWKTWKRKEFMPIKQREKKAAWTGSKSWPCVKISVFPALKLRLKSQFLQEPGCK